MSAFSCSIQPKFTTRRSKPHVMKTSAPKPVRAKIQKRRSINDILRMSYRKFTRDTISLQAIKYCIAS